MTGTRLQFVEVLTPEPIGGLPAPDARMPAIIGVTRTAAVILASLRIAIVGLGSIGGRVAKDLARMGVAELRLCDPGIYSETSHLTHDTQPAQRAQTKVMVVGRQCKDISPSSRVLMFEGGVEALPWSALADCDAAILATDNLPAEVETGVLTRRAGIPLFQAAVDGSSLFVVVRSFRNKDESSPCPQCLFGKTETTAFHAKTKRSCSSATVPMSRAPTMSFGSLCALGAAQVSLQVIRWALKLTPDPLDTVLMHNAYTQKIMVSSIAGRRRPDCLCEHLPWQIMQSTLSLEKRTVLELAAAAGLSSELQVSLENHVFVQKGVCRCPTPVDICRFVGQTGSLGSCARCNAPLVAQRFHTSPAAPLRLLGQQAALPLERIGATAPPSVLLRSANSRPVLIFES